MSKEDAEVVLKLARGTVGMCGCGRPLIPSYDENGKRLGVTHESSEDEDWHMGFWGGFRADISEGDSP